MKIQNGQIYLEDVPVTLIAQTYGTPTYVYEENRIRDNFRRDMQTVLFGAWFGEKFSDNPRFLFQYLSENRSALGLNRVVWVTRDEAVCETIREMAQSAAFHDPRFPSLSRGY